MEKLGLLTIVLWIVVFYLFAIAPQKRKEKERKRLLNEIKKNDEILTVGGIYGTITALKDDEITVRVDHKNNLHMRFSRSAVNRVITSNEKGDK